MEKAYEFLFGGALIILALCIIAIVIKAIIGPRLTDRIVCVNMASTAVTSCIVILAIFLGESYLLDVSIIYVLVSFIAVVVLTNVFVNKYEENKDGDK